MNNIILLAAHHVVSVPLPQRQPRFKGNKRPIELHRSHAEVVITDYTEHGLAFTAKFFEKGQAVPFVEAGPTAAAALRKLMKNPHVKACRIRAWKTHTH